MVDIVLRSLKVIAIFSQGFLISYDNQSVDFSFLSYLCNLFIFPSDDISYRTRTDSCIQITINFIKHGWITNSDGYFFGP